MGDQFDSVMNYGVMNNVLSFIAEPRKHEGEVRECWCVCVCAEGRRAGKEENNVRGEEDYTVRCFSDGGAEVCVCVCLT